MKPAQTIEPETQKLFPEHDVGPSWNCMNRQGGKWS